MFNAYSAVSLPVWSVVLTDDLMGRITRRAIAVGLVSFRGYSIKESGFGYI